MQRTKAILLMVLCTLILTLAQYFQKIAGDNLAFTLQGTLYNWPFFAGIACAGIGAVLMTLAFKEGELSTLFPILSLSFIWTIGVGVFIFKESLQWEVSVGIFCIVLGIAILGKGEKR